LSKQFLIFVSRDFPYGFREPYVEDEINEFSQHYHKVFLMVPFLGAERRKEKIRKLPDNVVIIQVPTQRGFFSRFTDLLFLFTKLFWKELSFQRKEHHLSINRQRFRDVLGYLGSAFYFKKILTKFLKSNHIPFKKTTFYSYHLSEFTLAMLWIKRRHRVAGVYSRFILQDDELHSKFSAFQPFRRYILNKINAVFSVSNLGRDYLFDQAGPGAPPNILVHRLGVRKVQPIVTSRENGVLKILTVSFLEKHRRIALLVEALEMAEHLEIEWHHIGDGNDQQNMKQFAFNHLFNKPNVKFRFTADLNTDQVYEIIQQDRPHVFISLSQHEDIPVSILEAFSFGIPVIAANVGGIAEVLQNGVNGILLSANPTAAELVEALNFMVQMDTKGYRNFSNSALATYEQFAQVENNYGAMIYDMIQLSRRYE
jgi:glycosyltransferase involved in cell wall biosynthesis